MTDQNENMKHRLKASELLAKSNGAFVEKFEVKEEKIETLADLMIKNYEEKHL